VYDLNPKIRAMVQMWKPSSVAEVIENIHYTEDNMSLNGGMRSTIPQHPGFMEMLLGITLGEEALGHLLMEIELLLDQLQQVFQWKRVQHPTHHQ
jgi:hypothetical protein